MATSSDAKLAVLVDADNTSPGVVDALLTEIAKYGVASVKRAYGDWTRDNLKGWKQSLNEHAIRPVQQFAYTTGKNATDGAMIIDAMDLLYTGRFDGFCLVTSDSDFTGLATRLREAGVTVYGFGEKKTPKPLVAACDRFLYLDVLRASSGSDDETVTDDQPERKGPVSAADLRKDTRLVGLVRAGIDAGSDDEGWANLGSVGSHITNQASDFDPRNWGFTKLVDLVEAIGLFEVERDERGVTVREKPKAARKTTQRRRRSAGQAASLPAD